MFLSLPSQQLMGGDYSSISLYHLFTHASFKALLFLTSGLLIHLYGGLSSQDSRFYSSLSITTPLLSSLLFFSSLSLFG
jgi:NADH:ubiquinone oxidoreductase subunit 5 (subunit L)/multisubunit Na+/H+ antiporter MnhA subunit